MAKDWYEQAAKDLVNSFDDNEGGSEEVLKYISESFKKDPRFHFADGMEVRNRLRELGYRDNIYGNLDDHYQAILRIAFEMKGI